MIFWYDRSWFDFIELGITRWTSKEEDFNENKLKMLKILIIETIFKSISNTKMNTKNTYKPTGSIFN